MTGLWFEGALQEVIVTAQKREQSLQDVSLAVSAIDSTTLTDNFVLSLEDVQHIAPSMTFGNSLGFAKKSFIRGIGCSTSRRPASTTGSRSPCRRRGDQPAGRAFHLGVRSRPCRDPARPAGHAVRAQCHRRLRQSHYGETDGHLRRLRARHRRQLRPVRRGGGAERSARPTHPGPRRDALQQPQWLRHQRSDRHGRRRRRYDRRPRAPAVRRHRRHRPAPVRRSLRRVRSRARPEVQAREYTNWAKFSPPSGAACPLGLGGFPVRTRNFASELVPEQRHRNVGHDCDADVAA